MRRFLSPCVASFIVFEDKGMSGNHLPNFSSLTDTFLFLQICTGKAFPLIVDKVDICYYLHLAVLDPVRTELWPILSRSPPKLLIWHVLQHLKNIIFIHKKSEISIAVSIHLVFWYHSTKMQPVFNLLKLLSLSFLFISNHRTERSSPSLFFPSDLFLIFCAVFHSMPD